MDNQTQQIDEQKLVRKITLRIIPFLFFLYIISYLDRANIGYAALEMNKELAITSEAFGFISGIFFIGYFLFEVPSNVMLKKYGSRIWIARILISWGIIATLTAFAQNSIQLYILRFLLGVAEAGFFPGIVIYLTFWFRSKELATTFALFTSAIPVSYIIGAPLSTWIMDNINWLNWSGWRWMLFLEGIPAVIFGIICLFYLTESPDKAKWLNTAEKAWLINELKQDAAKKTNVQQLTTLQAMVNPKVLYLSLIYFVYQCGSLGIGYWLPQIIKSFSNSLTHTQIGLIAMLPYIVATIVMILWSRSSDRNNERKFHTYFPLFWSSLALFSLYFINNNFVSLTIICIALAGLYSFKSPFWAVPTLFLTPSSAAISVAVINSIGNLGGFVGPSLLGVVNGKDNNPAHGLMFLGILLLIGACMVFFMKLNNKRNSSTVLDKA
ncbi:MFS transporter [Acinetobacter baumannii]|uniref:MFS transporter n=1 Tax=Acinetobacter baumannii TaxID=470 RepID=UPI00186B5BF4|nr:MFS transporter [Acinetobacter baumannii]MBE4721344.1 MFS transporter [Acinetobacter baumannii]MDH2525641.1 MFS transporter [Acinetobacter baumannii]